MSWIWTSPFKKKKNPVGFREEEEVRYLMDIGWRYLSHCFLMPLANNLNKIQAMLGSIFFRGLVLCPWLLFSFLCSFFFYSPPHPGIIHTCTSAAFLSITEDWGLLFGGADEVHLTHMCNLWPEQWALVPCKALCLATVPFILHCIKAQTVSHKGNTKASFILLLMTLVRSIIAKQIGKWNCSYHEHKAGCTV